MKADFTYEMVFSFEGPNLCLLGNEEDFKKIATAILELTIPNKPHDVELLRLDFIENIGRKINIIFSSRPKSKYLGKILNNGEVLIFELDARYWERIFKYFVLMTWAKKTYYLNTNEDCLLDLELDQECNLICSSEF